MNNETLCDAMPGLSLAKADEYRPLMENAMRRFDITSRMRAAMWLAQVGHESVSLTYMEEIDSGAKYEGRQDLGNTQAGDGVKFKGRGPIQVTGRTNYTQAGEALGLDLVNHPELAEQPAHAFEISAWWWSAHDVNSFADAGDVVGATKRINGGTNGLSDREGRYSRVMSLGDAVVVGEAASGGGTDSGEDDGMAGMDQAEFNKLMNGYVGDRQSPLNPDHLAERQLAFWELYAAKHKLGWLFDGIVNRFNQRGYKGTLKGVSYGIQKVWTKK